MIDIARGFGAAGIGVGFGWIAAEVTIGPADAGLERLLDAEVVAAAARLAGARAQDLPAVAATRAAYKALGKDPARYRPAAEALLRRVAQGKRLQRISNVVDVNNLLSLATGLSIGTYDGDRLTPPLTFRPGRSGESYVGIGRGPLNLENLPLFADARGPFGSPTSDSERSMVTAATRRIVMVLAGFVPCPADGAVLARACELLEAHCGAQVEAARLIAAVEA